jgi:intermembrane space import and assembly protein 40
VLTCKPAAIGKLDEAIHHVQESELPTLEAIAEERRKRREEEAAEAAKVAQIIREGQSTAATDEQDVGGNSQEQAVDGVEGLEEEADQQGAFNPETGEINWDCPCLGGMAHGPCGEEFKAAFSCFVYSKEEPKGMECIDKFKWVPILRVSWHRLTML